MTPGPTCYHGRRLDPEQGTASAVEVIAHDAPAEWRGVMDQRSHHDRSRADGFNWGYIGAGPANLARELLISVLGSAALCDSCGGSRRVVWASSTDLDEPEPWHPVRHMDVDPARIDGCWCADGIRSLPYHQFAREVVSDWGDRWRIGRAEILRWLVAQWEKPPPWLTAAATIETVELPP